MKTIIKEYQVYDYLELSEEAKERVRQDLFINDDIRNKFFEQDTNEYLKTLFSKSNLRVQYSLGYCQGDGFNIYGEFNLYDILDIIDLNEKEKRTIEFYLEKSDYYIFNFIYNNRYNYSCKFLDKKNLDYEISEMIENLQYCEIKNINEKLIEKFYNLFIDYMDGLDRELKNDGYDYLYNIQDEEIVDTCECNNWLFTKDGVLI